MCVCEQAHRYFSGIVCLVFLFYFLLISITDYALWKTWNQQHAYNFVVAGVAAINWFIFSKSILPRKKTLITGNIFLLILLILLAAGRAMGGGYVSYTLAVCTATATIVLCLNPIHYSILALTAMCCEIFFNYHFIGKYFEQFFRFHHREDELSALIHIDLDNFKTVNDTLGHQGGDWALTKVAEILHNTFQKSDCIARVGGDEFMVFMPKLSENQNAYEKIQNLLKQFPVMVEGKGGVTPIFRTFIRFKF